MKKFTRIFLSILPVLVMVFGLLIYAVGCMMDAMIVEIFGALFVLGGIIAFAERKWAAEEK